MKLTEVKTAQDIDLYFVHLVQQNHKLNKGNENRLRYILYPIYFLLFILLVGIAGGMEMGTIPCPF